MQTNSLPMYVPFFSWNNEPPDTSIATSPETPGSSAGVLNHRLGVVVSQTQKTQVLLIFIRKHAHSADRQSIKIGASIPGMI